MLRMMSEYSHLCCPLSLQPCIKAYDPLPLPFIELEYKTQISICQYILYIYILVFLSAIQSVWLGGRSSTLPGHHVLREFDCQTFSL